MVILRLIHIVAGIFWAGAAFFMVSFISPAVEATGPEGQKFMRQLGIKSGMGTALAATATLTAVSGIIMYIILTDLDRAIMEGAYFTIIFIGSIAGIAGWITGFTMQNRSTSKMKAIVADIEAAGGPPSPEQMAEMQALAHRVGQGGRITAVLLTVAVVCMAAAQPVAALLA
jgi:uncharacterized membrane protein